MSAVQSIITELVIKPLETPDHWGNTYRRGFKTAQFPTTIFGCGGGKKPAICIKDGKGFYDLQVGDEIQFFYETNGDYFNVKSSKISIVRRSASVQGVANVPAGATPAVQAVPTPTLPASAPPARSERAASPSFGYDSRSKEIKAGRAVNLAVELFTAGQVGSLEDGLKEAIRLEVLADTYYEALYKRAKTALPGAQGLDGNAAVQPPVVVPAPSVRAPEPEPTPSTPAVPVPAPAQALVGDLNLPADDDGFNDDIPF